MAKPRGKKRHSWKRLGALSVCRNCGLQQRQKDRKISTDGGVVWQTEPRLMLPCK